MHSVQRGLLGLYKLLQRLQAVIQCQDGGDKYEELCIRSGALMVHREGDMEDREKSMSMRGSCGTGAGAEF